MLIAMVLLQLRQMGYLCFAGNYFLPVASCAKCFPLSALGKIVWSSAIHLIINADRMKNVEGLKENLKIATFFTRGIVPVFLHPVI